MQYILYYSEKQKPADAQKLVLAHACWVKVRYYLAVLLDCLILIVAIQNLLYH